MVSVSYASSSPDLDDRINYPYFLRTVPSDVTQADAMFDIIKEMGWQYVGIIYVDNNYGSKGKLLLEQKARDNYICIGTEVKISETPKNQDQELWDLTTKLSRDSHEQVFIYFGTESRMIDLLEKMDRRRIERNYKYNFTFLVSEDIGESSSIRTYHGAVARGMISFKFQSNIADDSLGAHLKMLTPTMKSHNNWFRENWRSYFDCDPQGDYDKSKGRTCSSDLRFSDQDIQLFQENQRIVHIMNGVYAAGIGLAKLKNSTCPTSLLICNNPKWVPTAVETIRNVTLEPADQTSGIKPFRVFDDNGNGNVGFKVNNLQLNPDGTYDYVQVNQSSVKNDFPNRTFI